MTHGSVRRASFRAEKQGSGGGGDESHQRFAGGDPTHARLTEALDDVDRRCRELHAAFITARERLLRVVNEAVEHLTSLPASTMESEPATPSVH